MKIKKIVFNNFRNYKGNHIFDLNRDITILYGENGNGKSSFFDGIEWCLTGYISRFTDKKPPKEALANKEIKNEEECYVEFYFSNFCIKRAFSKSLDVFSNIDFCLLSKSSSEKFNKIAIGEEKVDKKLRELFEQEGIEYKDNKYKVGEMINKAYILSQDQVSDFVSRDKPGERFNALASIMGFEKIVKMRKNLSLSKSLLKEKNVELKEVKIDLLSRVKTLDEKLKPVDKKYLSGSDVYFKSKNEVLEEINNYYINIANLNNEIKYINSIKTNKYETMKDFEEKQKLYRLETSNKEKELKKLFIKEDKVKSEIIRIKKVLKENTDISKENNIYIELENDIENLNVKIKNLIEILELKSVKSYEKKNFEKDLYEIQNDLRKVEFTIVNKEEYEYSKLFLRNFENKIADEKNFLNEKKEILTKLVIKENNLKDKILKNSKNSSVSILINSIRDIQKYVEYNDSKGYCPVCSSNVGENLNGNILNNLNQLVTTATKNNQILEKEIKERESLEIEVFNIKKIIEEMEGNIKRLEINKIKALKTVETIEKNLNFGKYFSYNFIELQEKEIKLKKDLKNYHYLLELVNEIQEKREKILRSTKTSYISNNEISLLEKDLDQLFITLKENEDETKQQEKLMLEKNTMIMDFNTLKNKYNELLKKYKYSSMSDVINKLEKDLTKEYLTLEAYKKLLPNIENNDYNMEIEKEKSILENEVEKNKQKLDYFNVKQSSIEKVITNLDREYGGEATDFLNDSNSAIQSYYRYLNPSPGEFNNLFFDIQDNENLYIKIKQNQSPNGENASYYTDANMVLSSGQLNVLALSIFIATNGAQTCSYFDFIAIDDPIQNMDDINRFSVTDILSNLNQQLIFSTHDQEFLNLFLKKNELRMKDINIFTLDANENIYKSISIK